MSSITSAAQVPLRKYYIFGHNISHSLSPHLHNAGFKELDLPCHYSIHQSEQVDKSVEDLISETNFGGASVTFPHKLQVGRLLDTISPRATQIGAVNTIIAKDTENRRLLIGDNTDWSGIKACIQKSGVSGLEKSSGLVLGAGGAARAACYAMQVLGIKAIDIVNRTSSKAEEMAANFPEIKFRIFESLEQLCSAGEKPKVIVACIPADDLGENRIPKAVFAEKEGVLVEMAYRPPKTGMMMVAARSLGWTVFRGTDVLEEQAYAQFTLWTERAAPQKVMRESMIAAMNERL